MRNIDTKKIQKVKYISKSKVPRKLRRTNRIQKRRYREKTKGGDKVGNLMQQVKQELYNIYKICHQNL